MTVPWRWLASRPSIWLQYKSFPRSLLAPTKHPHWILNYELVTYTSHSSHWDRAIEWPSTCTVLSSLATLICRTSRHANDGNLIKKLKWNWQGYLLKTPDIHMWNALSQGNQMLATAKVDIAALFAQVKIHGSSSHPDICVETSKNHLWSNSACI